MGTTLSEAIGRGIWRLRGDCLPLGAACSSFLVRCGDGFYLVDPGPASLAAGFAAAAAEIAGTEALRGAVILDESPYAWTGIDAWREAGFRGELFASRRTAEALAFLGAGPVEALGEGSGPPPSRLSGLAPVEYEAPEGALALFHADSGILLSGSFSALRGWTAPREGPFPPSGVQTLYPRLGEPFSAAEAASLADAARAPAAARQPGKAQAEEIDSLRDSNYELRESLVMASDAALRDKTSGLYGRAYADTFMETILQRGGEFGAAFIKLDRIKEINARGGADAADRILKDLADLLQSLEEEAFFFRGAGPSILGIFEGGTEDAFPRLERLRAAVSSDRRFPEPVTVSIALVGSGELGGRDPRELQSLAKDRLRLLERRGGNSILAVSDIRTEDKSLILVLDQDPLFMDLCLGRLEREGFKPIGAVRGGEAFGIMDRARPELVIAELSLPQFDAFQIRERMRSSDDLHGVPFILLCTAKTEEIIARAHSLSVYHVLEKPVSMTELCGLARSLLAGAEDEA